MSLHQAAQHLASRGRGEDSLLIHMTPKEVSGLQALAQAHGKSLTFNPDTGLPEAGILSSILPMVIGAGLTVASGGALTPLMAAAITGGGYMATTGSLRKGLMAGLGAYGGGSIGAGIADMGATSLAGEAAAPQLATLNNTMAAMPGVTADAMFMGPTGASDIAAASAAQTGFGEAANAAKMAAMQNGYGMDALGRGFSQMGKTGGIGQLTSRLGGDMGALKMAGMAAAPLFADQAVPQPATTTQQSQGMVRPMQFSRRQIPGGQQTGDAYTGERRHFDDQLTQLAAYNPTERGYAGGGAVMDVPGFADGGIPEGWAVNGDNWYRNGDVYSAAQAQAMIAAAAPPPVLAPPAGWSVTPGGDQYYRNDPVAGGSNILSPSQAAYTWGADNPERYLPTPTPAPQNYPPPPPGWATPEDGTGYTQMQQSWLENNHTPYDPAALASQQLLASGQNRFMPPATETDRPGRVTPSGGPTTVTGWATPPPTPAPTPGPGAPPPGAGPTPLPDPITPTPVPQPPPPGGVLPPPGTPTPAPPPGTPTPAPPPGGTPVPPPGTPVPGAPSPIGGNPAPPPGPPIGGPQRDLSVTPAMPWGSAARDYFMQNPDVADGFRNNNFGMSADDFARQHFEKFGRNEGRYYRGLSQPRVTRANPMNTTKGASRNALEYLAGEAPLAAPAPSQRPTTPDLSDMSKLLKRTAEEVKPDSFAQSYVDRYPDIYLAYQKDPMGMDINEFVRQHYVNYGQKEGRIWGDTQSLNQQNGYLAGGGGDGPGSAGDGAGSPGDGGPGGGSSLAGGGKVQGQGLMALAGGGQGRLLRGPGDGVSDSIPATINGGQPAALSDGEFVVPARIVSELGNGSTEAGARQLYAMLDRIQNRRAETTGKGEVAVDSKASAVMPA